MRPDSSHCVRVDPTGADVADAISRAFSGVEHGTPDVGTVGMRLLFVAAGPLERVPPRSPAVTSFDRQPGSLVAMASDAPPLSADEFLARVRAGAPTTADDVSITLDGRRLDSKEAVLAWLAEVEADRAAGRLVELDGD